MWKSFRIGSLFGIPIKLDLTFLLVLPFFAYLIGVQIGMVADLLNDLLGAGIDTAAVSGGPMPLVLGFAAAIGLFIGVVLHELGHSLTARRYGFPIDSITLWLLGGVASFTEMPEDWKQELAISIAGPIVSVLVGALSYGLFLLTPASVDGALFVFGYLAVLNVALAGFNMLPAFPMDGGRVLRALLARNQPYAKATQQAASIGKFFAVLMGLFGLLVTFNIILIGVAFFIYIAASGESQQVTMKAAFQDVTVGDIMTPARDLHTVAPDTSVEELIQRMFSERHTGYPVLDNGHLVGLVTLSDAQEVKPVERDAFTVSDVMTTDLQTIDANSDAMTAIERMQSERIGRLLVVDGDDSMTRPDASIQDEAVYDDGGFDDPVLEDAGGSGTEEPGDLVGLISRTDMMTALNIVQQSGEVNHSSQSQPLD
ncbi:CBS domain-containing protein [Halostagnicola kamekurae]|uniref:Zinc metalloprotease n=1 Tax=Halostagnicola kamekurae TaxID=619731 RepID=A0A1I6RLI5_9EURY|nr:CBS domain-containing protein [Halostagnicola kamekurae]SFS65514.1 Zn-dependent protease (includes SpoIVFB) [Halostagnicola kamekurae]